MLENRGVQSVLERLEHTESEAGGNDQQGKGDEERLLLCNKNIGTCVFLMLRQRNSIEFGVGTDVF